MQFFFFVFGTEEGLLKHNMTASDECWMAGFPISVVVAMRWREHESASASFADPFLNGLPSNQGFDRRRV